MRRLLLVSSSTTHGTGYLDHCEDEIRRALRDGSDVTFVPWAGHDHAAYTEKARERFAEMGYKLESLHESDDPAGTLRHAEAVFIGGGNTFRLLAALQRACVLGVIAEQVAAGVPYIGTSAGSNVAGPTIATTNDMPIVQPESFAAMGLVPFQINPHYLDADPNSKHRGETREQRLAEYHEENATPVLALREGAMLRVSGDRATLLGAPGGKLFVRGRPAEELEDGRRLDALLMV